MTGQEASAILRAAALKSKDIAAAHAFTELAKHVGMDAFAPAPHDPMRIAMRTAELLDHPESAKVK